MTTTFIRHRVKDYDAWRRVYDDFAGVQAKAGVTAKAVYRSAADPNDVLVMHRFGNIDQAQDFMALAELKEAMMNAGVEGAPQIDIFDDAD